MSNANVLNINLFPLSLLKYPIVVACLHIYVFVILSHIKSCIAYSNSYEEDVTYVQQTISLPASYSVAYDSSSEFTTVTIKGPAVDCSAGGKSGKTKTNKFN